MEQSADESRGSSSGGADFFGEAGLDSCCGGWAAARGAWSGTMRASAMKADTIPDAGHLWREVMVFVLRRCGRSARSRVSYRIAMLGGWGTNGCGLVAPEVTDKSAQVRRGDVGVESWMRSFAPLRMTATTKANGPAKAGRYKRKYLLADVASPGRFLAWRQGGGTLHSSGQGATALQR